MNELLTAMASDMRISSFQDEAEDDFIYRICYSALGQWCLHSAQKSTNGNVETTKHYQTIMLNELIARYSELFPAIKEKLNPDDKSTDLAVHIRRVYEETGYLLTDMNNHNRLANFGRTLLIGDTALFFGKPTTNFSVNGLGVFRDPTNYRVTATDFLIRDSLTCEEFFNTKYETLDFHDRDINIDELEFFNPLLNKAPSSSWIKKMEIDCTVARKDKLGPYYRIMRTSDVSLQFADEPIEMQNDTFTSYEFRRLYFALKVHYNNPLRAFLTRIDNQYSKFCLKGHLPNREYYFLLLVSWPMHDAFDKGNFLVKNEFVSDITGVLSNIGITVQGENANE